MEEELPLPSSPSSPPEPEQTGTQPDSQKAGSPIVAVLPAVRSETGGLRASSNVADLFEALQNQTGQQLRDVLHIVGDGIDRQYERMHGKTEKLEGELRDEKVAHARTEQRLEHALIKSGTSA